MVQLSAQEPSIPQEDSYDHIQHHEYPASPGFRSDDEEEWVDEETSRKRGQNGRGPAQVITSNARLTVASPRRRRKAMRVPSRSSSAKPPSFQFPPAATVPPPLPRTPEEDQKERKATKVAPRAATPPPAPTPTPPVVLPGKEEIVYHLVGGIKWGIGYAFSIVKPAIRFLRFPLTFIFFLFIVAAILNRVSSTLSAAFSPFCYIPGLSFTPMCRWTTHPPPPTTTQKVLWPDYPSLMDLQGRAFEQLMDESLGSSSLSLDLKKTEIATADLVALVRLSDLASKESLANTLGEFIHGAKSTGRSLHRLEAKLNGAFDSIMAMNDFSLHAIEGAREKQSNTMGLTIWKPKKSLEDIITETFSDAMDVLSEHMARLILELEANYENLENLDEKLNTLRDILFRENKVVGEAKEELLANLWTVLGGNRKDLRSFNRNLKTLQDLTVYRQHATAHVVATLHTLQGMSQDMEDMRERVAAPNLAGSKIPPEVHIKSIQSGLERLKEGRSRARKMEEAALRRAMGA